MKILLTNDDGIEASGLKALFHAVKDLGETAVVAPKRPQDATSHAISLKNPFCAEPIDWPEISSAYVVESTPSDCVRLAVLKLLSFRPDFVVSGINQGANYGTLALYSGTVGAAMEAALLGIPAIAVSLASRTSDDFSAAAQIARRILMKIPPADYPKDSILNVNVPPLPLQAIRGVRVVPQGRFRYEKDLTQDPRQPNRFSYVLDAAYLSDESDKVTDERSVREGYVAVTPIKVDWTDTEYLMKLSENINDALIQ